MIHSFRQPHSSCVHTTIIGGFQFWCYSLPLGSHCHLRTQHSQDLVNRPRYWRRARGHPRGRWCHPRRCHLRRSGTHLRCTRSHLGSAWSHLRCAGPHLRSPRPHLGSARTHLWGARAHLWGAGTHW